MKFSAHERCSLNRSIKFTVISFIALYLLLIYSYVARLIVGLEWMSGIMFLLSDSPSNVAFVLCLISFFLFYTLSVWRIALSFEGHKILYFISIYILGGVSTFLVSKLIFVFVVKGATTFIFSYFAL